MISKERLLILTLPELIFSYAPGSGEVSFDEIFIDSKDLKATADGFLIIEDIKDIPETFVAQLNFTDLQTGGFGLLNNGISSNSAATTFKVQLDPFDVEIPSCIFMIRIRQ